MQSRKIGSVMEGGIVKSVISGTLQILLLTSILTLTINIQLANAEPETIYVDDDNTTGPWNGTRQHPYQNITSALTKASAGDTVFVFSGKYSESLVIDKQIITLIGENTATTIIDATEGDAIKLERDVLTPDFTTITGFTLNASNGSGIYYGGTEQENVHDVQIYGNNITGAMNYGIYLRQADDSRIHRNHLAFNNNSGITLIDTADFRIYHNNFVDNTPEQAVDNLPEQPGNTWYLDYGCALGGNYWNDHTWPDNNEPYGIVDTPRYGNGFTDEYPLTDQVYWDVAITNVTASPSEAYDGETVTVTVVAENQGNWCNETFDVTCYYDNVTIGTKTVEDLPARNNTTIMLNFTWDTTDVPEGNYTIKAEATLVPFEKETGDNTFVGNTVEVHQTIKYMQNAKWDSTYWKMLWNNTATFTTQSKNKPSYSLYGYLGVRIYNGFDELTSGVHEVSRWTNLECGIKNSTWSLADDVNITGTYLQVKIYYKFQGDSWTYMGVIFKTATFIENTILNATDWTIYLYGSYYVQGGPLGPMGPGGSSSSISFSWGSDSRESRIEDMVLFNPS
jgi:parallel beta-helix repeat protein